MEVKFLKVPVLWPKEINEEDELAQKVLEDLGKTFEGWQEDEYYVGHTYLDLSGIESFNTADHKFSGLPLTIVRMSNGGFYRVCGDEATLCKNIVIVKNSSEVINPWQGNQTQ